MRKFIIFLVAAFMSLTVNAQITKVAQHYEFKIGDYIFESEWMLEETDEIIHRKFKKKNNQALHLEDLTDENYALGWFMKENKDTLEKRFGILIEEIHYDFMDCYVRISRPEDIQAKNARWEEEKRRSKEMKEGRIKSLEDFL